MASNQYIDTITLGAETYEIRDTKSGYATTDTTSLDNYTTTDHLASVAITGSYTDLMNIPDLPSFAGSTFTVAVTKLNDSGTESTTNTVFKALIDDGQTGYGNRTATIDLRNYILATRLPIAGSGGMFSNVSGMGCINLNADYGFALDGTYGYLQVQSITDINAFNNKLATFAISKGTLNTVLTARNYLQSSNYATDANGGTLKTAAAYGTSMATSGNPAVSTGQLCSTIVAYENYDSASNQMFISKGTLENVIAGKGLIDNTVNNLVNYTTTNNLVAVARTGSYNDLIDKPTIPIVNNGILTIQQNGATIDSFSANASLDTTVNIIVPTSVSDLTNDSNFIDPTYFTTITGYDASATQTLKNVNGTLTWVTDTI